MKLQMGAPLSGTSKPLNRFAIPWGLKSRFAWAAEYTRDARSIAPADFIEQRFHFPPDSIMTA
jgi:hypothetical protein